MEQMTFEQQAAKIKEMEEQLDKYKIVLRHVLPQISAYPFICGQVGEVDKNGLPKMFLICPSYGLDGFAVYTKTADYRAPGW